VKNHVYAIKIEVFLLNYCANKNYFTYFCSPNFKFSHMYAIVEIAGQQFKVQKDQQVFVHRLDAEEGSNLVFDKVLLVDNDGAVTVGAPAVSGAKVSATVLSHLKGDKVIVFKKKRRKGYQKSNGHRQQFTEIKIDSITA
jgi:large subunit ribosomal protein L21